MAVPRNRSRRPNLRRAAAKLAGRLIPVDSPATREVGFFDACNTASR